MTATNLKPVEILRDTFQRVGPVFLPVLLLALPGVLISVLVRNAMLQGLLNVIYVILVAPILGGAMIILVNRCLTGQTTDLSEAVAMAWRKAGNLILTSLLLVVILIPAFVFLLIPGIYLSIRLFSAQYAVVLENKSPTEALSASWELTQGKWWKIFWAVFGVTLALVIPLFIVSAIVGAALPWSATIVSNLLGLVITPPIAMALLMVYKVLKGEATLDADGANPASA